VAFPLNGLAAFAFFFRFVRYGLAAFLGSLVFAFSFYVILHAGGHLHLIWLWPLPLSLLLLERWFDSPTPSRLAAWTVVVLLHVLTSWYLAVIVLIANGAWRLTLCVDGYSRSSNSSPRWRRRGAHLAVAAVVVAGCVYPFARYYVGIESAGTEISQNSADVASYLVPPENTVVGRWWEGRVNDAPRWIFGEQTVFAGWTR
jgi:hypothetical protein